ncbi:hypothetical protein PUN28_007387 [Cardiocondyla obscurior]|uniref:Uncharacterized protein n=1 Tax=Cardiocondyla obscurior TaxID=286306 RepID=A0AAW2G388_9HYME
MADQEKERLEQEVKEEEEEEEEDDDDDDDEEDDEEEGRGGGGRVRVGQNTSALSRVLPPAALRNPPGPRNAPEPALPPSRTTTIYPIPRAPGSYSTFTLLPPGIVTYHRRRGYPRPRGSPRRFSRVRDPKALHARTNARTNSRIHAMPTAAGNGCVHLPIRPRSLGRCD